MLRNKDFWVGLLIGLIVCYVYHNYMKKGQSL